MGPPTGGGQGASRPSSPACMQQTLRWKQAATLRHVQKYYEKCKEAHRHLEETGNEIRQVGDGINMSLNWHARRSIRPWRPRRIWPKLPCASHTGKLPEAVHSRDPSSYMCSAEMRERLPLFSSFRSSMEYNLIWSETVHCGRGQTDTPAAQQDAQL